MPDYRYVAKDSSGRNVKGKVFAESEAEAIRDLTDQGLFPLNIRSLEPTGLPVSSAGISGTAALLNVPGIAVGIKQMAVLTREMAVMIHSGLDIHSTLEAASESSSITLRHILKDLGREVSSGTPLHEAMEKYPVVFSRLYRSIVKSGETGGNLEQVLMQLAGALEDEWQLRIEVQKALGPTYIILPVMLAALFILSWISWPGMAPLFRAVRMVVLSVIVVMVIASVRVFAPFFRNLVSVLPYFGGLMKKFAISRFVIHLGLLYEAGVPLPQAVEVASETVNLFQMTPGINRMRELVLRGEDLATAMRRSGVFPKMTVFIVGTGEAAGSVGLMLRKIKDYYQMELNYSVTVMVRMIPAVLTLIAGIVVFIIVVKFWSGYFQLITGAVGD